MYIHFADRISIGAVFIRINSHDYCTMHITGRIVKKKWKRDKKERRARYRSSYHSFYWKNGIWNRIFSFISIGLVFGIISIIWIIFFVLSHAATIAWNILYMTPMQCSIWFPASRYSFIHSIFFIWTEIIRVCYLNSNAIWMRDAHLNAHLCVV